MAKATRKQSSKRAPKATTPAQAPAKQAKQAPAVVVPPKGAKHTGALPKGLVVPGGYVPTVRAVAAAQAKATAAPGQPVQVVSWGRARAAGVPWCAHAHGLLMVLASLPGPVGSTAVVLAAQAMAGKLPAGCVVTPRNVRHYSYHMATTGHVTVAGGQGGYTYAITPKGRAALKAGAF